MVKPNQTVDANAVTNITGSLTEINSVIAADVAGTIAVSDNFNATVSDTSITASALTTMSESTEGTIYHSSNDNHGYRYSNNCEY